MRGTGDRSAPKLLLLFIIVVLFYLAFFGFDLRKAYDYAYSADSSILQAIGF
ncbi:MAG TPA: hypothetical protein VHC20_05880 [Candidatus Paceibacterota bacterium]|nr:hypothetical protein [Candidatus Paceibacterota bacterium]